MRVIYSFPNRLGASRICYTAWQQINGIVSAGAEVLLYAGSVLRDVPPSVKVHTTLSRNKLRLPYRLIGRRNALALHDRLVAAHLSYSRPSADVIHVWPSAALHTIRTAKRLGIPTVLERPNAHTRFGREVVEAECQRIGMSKPHYDYRPNRALLAREEAEFRECDFLLCPSDFTAKSFLNCGFPAEKLLRHHYGFDDARFYPDPDSLRPERPFTALFVGVDPIRKGLHLALKAWLNSKACQTGKFVIAGEVSSEFQHQFAGLLSSPSVTQLGNRDDVPQLMRGADVLLMPSLEEGFALVCVEAIGSGCVPLASTACTEMCTHMSNALVHDVGDVSTLSRHISELYEQPALLAALRAGAIRSRRSMTWDEAGRALLAAYESAHLSSSSGTSGKQAFGI